MTWNELIDTLNEIPEERREEKAVFMTRISDGKGGSMPDEGMEIDSKEEINLEDGIFDATMGNDETTFVIAM